MKKKKMVLACVLALFTALSPSAFAAKVYQSNDSSELSLPESAKGHNVTFFATLDVDSTSYGYSKMMFKTGDVAYGNEFVFDTCSYETFSTMYNGTLSASGTYKIVETGWIVNTDKEILVDEQTGSVWYKHYSTGKIQMGGSFWQDGVGVGWGVAIFSFPKAFAKTSDITSFSLNFTSSAFFNPHYDGYSNTGFTTSCSWNANGQAGTWSIGGTYSCSGYIAVSDSSPTSGKPMINTKSFYAIDWDEPGDDVIELQKYLDEMVEYLKILIAQGDENVLAECSKLIEQLRKEMQIADATLKADYEKLIADLTVVMETKFEDVYNELKKKVDKSDLIPALNELLVSYQTKLAKD